MANPDDYGIYKRDYTVVSKTVIGFRKTKVVNRLIGNVDYFDWPNKRNTKIAPCKLLVWNNNNTRIGKC